MCPASVLSALLLAGTVQTAHPLMLGQTFPIAEPDTRQEIAERAARIDWNKQLQRAPEQYSAFASEDLPRASRNRSYLFDPTYALPRDIVDAQGQRLYAAGTRINVYERITVPGRYILIQPREEDYRWLDTVAKPVAGDKVLLAGGNVLAERERTGRMLYRLDRRFIERMGLQAVPAIVRQEGNRLRVSEFLVMARN